VGGTVLSSAQVMEQRERKGLCRICGKVRTHNRSLLTGFTSEPITKEGECLVGWCLKCHTIEAVLAKPGVRANTETKKIKWALKAAPMTPRGGSLISKQSNERRPQSFSSDDAGSPGSSSVHTALTDDTIPEAQDGPMSPSGATEKSILDIVQEMSDEIDNVSTQETGCAELAKVVAILQDPTAEELNVAVDAIVFAMKAHAQVVEVQKSGCAALHTLTSSLGNDALTVDVCTKLALNGGVFAVVSAMKQHLQARSVQREAIRVLRNVLRATERNKKLCILSEGEFSAILDSMVAHSHCKSVQVAAWKLIEVAMRMESNVKIFRENEILRTKLMDVAGRHHPSDCAHCVQAVLNVFSE